MPGTSNVSTNRLINELAGELTDPALEILTAAGVRGESVAMELELWHALADGLEQEVRRSRTGTVSEGVLQGVIHRAAVRVAAAFGAGIEAEVRPLLGHLRVTGRQQATVAGLFAASAESSRPLGRSGFNRRLTVTALN